MNFKQILLEDSRRRQVIRTIVRDIITVYKKEDEGEFYLPNHIEKDDDYYNFTNFDHNLIVELIIIENYDIEDFIVDANYWKDEEIIEIIIDYNPDRKFDTLYDLVGELNQIVAHEIRHIDQKHKGTHDLNQEEEYDPFKYYSQPHEVDAQVFGFNRLSKLTKKPYEAVVRSWFEKNKDIHRLNEKEKEEIIKILLNYKN